MKSLILAVLLAAVPVSAIAETESLKQLRELAKKGDVTAEFNIGVVFYEGRSQFEEGIWVEVISESIRRGSRVSILDTEQVADKIWDTLAGKKSPDPDVLAENRWANMDSSERSKMQRNSSMKSLRDKVQSRNYKNAAKWFGLAAKHGHAEAQYYIGALYGQGEGVKKNHATAIQWYRKAAAQGNVHAQSLLGDSYAFGAGVEKDDLEAAAWYRKAAAQGDGTAMQILECLQPATADSPSGTIVHTKTELQEQFTGCTWNRGHKNTYYPTIISYVNGQKHGRKTQWAGGPRWRTAWRRFREDSYVENVRQGPSSTWQHGTEQKSSEVSYVNGKEEGTYTLWYESGTKKQDGTYVNGMIMGEVTNWYESGVKSQVKNMDKNHPSGAQTRWYENGEKKSEGTIDKGTHLPFGLWTEYYENGQKKYVADYLWSNSTGKFQHTRPELGFLEEPGRVHWTDWYEDGQKKSEGLYVSFDQKHIDTPQRSNMSNPRQGSWMDWATDGDETRSCYKWGKRLHIGLCGSPEKPAAPTFDRAEASSTYKLYGNPKNPGHPSFDRESGVVTLTPVDVYGASGVAFLKESTTVPFVLTFEFNIWDNDGGNGWGKRYNSADGISVFFNSDESVYETTAPPGGSAMGYIEGESTLGLFFKTFEKRQVLLKDNTGILAKKNERRVYTHGAWQKARIFVNSDGIVLQFDDKTLIQWQGELPFEITNVAFGAGTGGSNSRHQIRNVIISAAQAP